MEAHRQFMRLSEGYLSVMKEDGEDDNEQNQEMNDPNAMQGNGQMPDMGQGNDMMGGQDMGGADPNMPPQGQDMGMPGQDMGAPGQDMGMPGQDMPMPDGNMDMGDGAQMPNMPDGGPIGDDTVIDVEDITKAQEKLNKKENEIGKDLGDVDNRISTLIAAINKIQTSIDKNNSDITSLKAELEKRVPTDTEKLNMQSLKMYPFNVSPNDYWKDKETEGVYDAMEGDDEKPHNIRQKDVDDYSESEIERSLDDELHQTMKDIFRGF